MFEFPTSAGSGRGYLALPTRTAAPAVLVLHAWWGLTPFFHSVCDQLAAAGYIALAPDLFDGRTADTIEGATALVQGLDERDNEGIHATTLGAIDALRAHPDSAGPMAAIGFSFGAPWALTLANERPADIQAVVLFYGAYTGLDHGPARAAYLGHFGAEDTWEPLDGVREMESEIRAAGRDVTFSIYPQAQHWFMENNRPEYRADDAALAWERTLAFLAQQLEASA